VEGSLENSQGERNGVGDVVRRLTFFTLLVLAIGIPASVDAQGQFITTAETTFQVPKGQGGVLRLDFTPTRIFIADTTRATVVIIDPRQYIVRGLELGTTSMFVWDQAGVPRMYKLEVIPDVTALQAQIRTLFPDVVVDLTLSGNNVIISGSIRDPHVAGRIIALVAQTGAAAINNMQVPPAAQVMLHVRIGEVRKSALRAFSNNFLFRNVHNLDQVVSEGSTNQIETLSEGIVRVFLSGGEADFESVIRALRSTGDFRSLAEPNLITLEGQEATFLAGGEFPFPSLQGGAQAGGISIQFRPFGVVLSFTPVIQTNGAIRLKVSPEVSSLDFANGLVISGFQIPSLISRKTSTNVELLPGQTLAIAGLLDNQLLESVDKIPFLGDLPIIGAFFRAKLNQQDRTELLVLVTPYLVEPSNASPPLPMGEPLNWRWDRNMMLHPDSVGRTMPQQRRGGTPR
jgi:pilus assembly protein CpaC